MTAFVAFSVLIASVLIVWSRVDDPVGIFPFVLFDDGRRRFATNAAGNALMFQE